MPGVQYNRQPCPWRVFDDLGNGFMIGCSVGSIFYFLKGKLKIHPSDLLLRMHQCPKTTAHLQWTMSCEKQSTISGRKLRPLGRTFLLHRVLAHFL